MKKLLYTINGINYLLFECPFPISTTQTKLDGFFDKIKSFKGIVQGCEKINGTFWVESHLKISVLIPENNSIMFSNSQMP